MPITRAFRLPREHAAFAPMTSIARIAIIAVTLALFLGSSLTALGGDRDLAVVFALATPLGISAWGFARAGHAEPALLLLSLVLIVVTTFVLVLSRFGAHDVALIAYGGIVLVGALLLSRRSFYWLTAVTLIAACGAFVADYQGLTRSAISQHAQIPQYVEFIVILAVFAVPGRYAAEVLFGSLGDAHRATTGDALTGLDNRSGFMAQGAQMLKARHGCALLFIADIRNFRRVNVVIGHAAADGVLQEAARRLRAAAGGHLVARVGDDEFAVLAAGLAGEQEAARLVTSVQNALSFEFSGVSVRSSSGHALSPRDAVGIEALLIAAEASLSRAKDDEPVRLAVPAH
jgi:diguanylate cyclase (GGDEF)-like protein